MTLLITKIFRNKKAGEHFLIVTLFAISIKTIGRAASMVLFSALSHVWLNQIEKQMIYCTYFSIIFVVLIILIGAFLLERRLIVKLYRDMRLAFWALIILFLLIEIIMHYYITGLPDYSIETFTKVKSAVCY